MNDGHIEDWQDPDTIAPTYTRGGGDIYLPVVPAAIDQHVGGAKLDAGKPDAGLLQFFARALLQVAWVGTYGQDKYSRGGFLEVEDGPNRYTAAMGRHWFLENIEGTYDQDPYLNRDDMEKYRGTIRHDAQVAWNALARLEMRLLEEEKNGQ